MKRVFLSVVAAALLGPGVALACDDAATDRCQHEKRAGEQAAAV